MDAQSAILDTNIIDYLVAREIAVLSDTKVESSVGPGRVDVTTVSRVDVSTRIDVLVRVEVISELSVCCTTRVDSLLKLDTLVTVLVGVIVIVNGRIAITEEQAADIVLGE